MKKDHPLLKTGIAALTAAAALSFTMATASSPAQAKVSEKFYGRVVHVSMDNIKVQNSSGKTLGFVMGPSFKNIVNDDGKPEQMVNLRPGTPVEIIYDTTVMGARHVDRVIHLHHGMMSQNR